MTAYTVALSKGGSTKTTTAAELVTALAQSGRKVLAIDLDPQGNLTARMGIRHTTSIPGVAADVLTGDATAIDAAADAPSVPGASILAGTHDLTGLDQRPELINMLQNCLPGLRPRWDDVVIDTTPSLGLFTLAALAAADVVIAAVACETEAFEQLARLDEVIAHRVSRITPGQRVNWVVPTKYDPRRRLDRDVLDQLNLSHPGRVTTPVREAVAARDAYTAFQPVSIYHPESGIAADYAAALAPIITADVPTPQTTYGAIM